MQQLHISLWGKVLINPLKETGHGLSNHTSRFTLIARQEESYAFLNCLHFSGFITAPEDECAALTGLIDRIEHTAAIFPHNHHARALTLCTLQDAWKQFAPQSAFSLLHIHIFTSFLEALFHTIPMLIFHDGNNYSEPPSKPDLKSSSWGSALVGRLFSKSISDPCLVHHDSLHRNGQCTRREVCLPQSVCSPNVLNSGSPLRPYSRRVMNNPSPITTSL